LISLRWDNPGVLHRRGASTQGEATVPPRLPLCQHGAGPAGSLWRNVCSLCRPPSLCGDKLLAVEDEILYHLAGLIISKKGAHRNSNDEVFSVLPRLVFAFSVDASSGTELLWIAEIEEGGKLSICLEDHIPPFPPSPPSGPPFGIKRSLRKLRHPFPPLPAITRILASSTNFILSDRREGEG